MTENPSIPDICDYEGSNYRTDFWEGRGRDYEDRAERIAIRRLMPLSGGRLLEVGAGFGRLSEMFRGYELVVLLDYSRSQLEFARQHYGDDGFLYVAANIYAMPFAPAVFDAVTMVRVLHHMQQPEQALSSIRQTMRQGGVFLLEFANKANVKSILRWLLRRQTWSPFDLTPVEFVALNYDFHPRFVRETLRHAGFRPGRALAVSYFRLEALKRLLPTGLLVALDSLLQFSGSFLKLAPSIFTHNEAVGDDSAAPEGAFWRCPACGSYDLSERGDEVDCGGCGAHWGIINGVYDFKEPLA